MKVTQLSVKVENKPGQLSRISDVLGDEGINVRAITAAVHGEDAQIHLVPDDPHKTLDVLKANGFEVREVPVLALETPDHPGGLNALLKPLKEAGVNVEYLYPLIGKYKGNAVMIVGAEPADKAIEALKKAYIKILDKELDAF